MNKTYIHSLPQYAFKYNYRLSFHLNLYHLLIFAANHAFSLSTIHVQKTEIQ